MPPAKKAAPKKGAQTKALLVMPTFVAASLERDSGNDLLSRRPPTRRS
jgi:hypothetical protein